MIFLVPCLFFRMRSVTLLCALAMLGLAAARPQLRPLSSEMINFINKADTTWTVRQNPPSRCARTEILINK